jgi:hypothetical protein
LSIDPLLVREFTTHRHFGKDTRTIDIFNIEYNLTVIQQQHIARMYIVWQTFVSNSNRLSRTTARIERDIQRKLIALGKIYLALRKALNANLWTLQIGEHAYPFAYRTSGIAHTLHALGMVIGVAMREINAHCIDTRANHFREHLWRIGCRT